jgi:hypothetical protein
VYTGVHVAVHYILWQYTMHAAGWAVRHACDATVTSYGTIVVIRPCNE